MFSNRIKVVSSLEKISDRFKPFTLVLSDPEGLNPRIKGEEKKKEPFEQPHKRNSGYESEEREIEPGEKPKVKNKRRLGSRGNVAGRVKGWLQRLSIREMLDLRE